MNKPSVIKRKLIAPCGMNCGLCIGFLREKNKCNGCWADDENKPKYCISCIIKNCSVLENSNKKYCFVCDKYPCKRLKQLDKRYRENYGMSMLNNLEYIQKNGIRKFVENERKKWKCKNCGSVISVHKKECISCGNIYKKAMLNK